MAAICALRHAFTADLMDLLGLSGKKLSSLEVKIKLNLESVVTLDVKYTEVMQEGTAVRLADTFKQYELHERGSLSDPKQLSNADMSGWKHAL